MIRLEQKQKQFPPHLPTFTVVFGDFIPHLEKQWADSCQRRLFFLHLWGLAACSCFPLTALVSYVWPVSCQNHDDSLFHVTAVIVLHGACPKHTLLLPEKRDVPSVQRALLCSPFRKCHCLLWKIIQMICFTWYKENWRSFLSLEKARNSSSLEQCQSRATVLATSSSRDWAGETTLLVRPSCRWAAFLQPVCSPQPKNTKLPKLYLKHFPAILCFKPSTFISWCD